MARKKKGIEHDLDYTKRGSTGLIWWVSKRFFKLNRLKNNKYRVDKITKPLLSVLTFKECEIIYQLPKGTCQRDYDNGKMRESNVRKSYSTGLITVNESIRLYENYWTERAKLNEKHLYLGLDGNKMTEQEYYIYTLGQAKDDKE
ncbi:hypothetical protein [Mammaliicoccus sp. E-M24]|uniref:hypothetical protein n=1 Tax=Mammaliicoccus sp. E-M24 TaxID=2898684 RepID=UPI001EFA42AF|nr:hypothetical protein [Mammaliicoccus sp. E-M24]